MSYKAIVCKIVVRPHPNAERILLGTVKGHQVVVGVNTRTGDRGVFFPSDGQLTEDMCMINSLYKTHPVTGEPMKGFFGSKRRVKAQKFRGELSDGFWCPINYLEWTGVDLDSLEEGFTFTSLNGIKICNKYISPATNRISRKNGRGKKKIFYNHMFAKHSDTEKLRYNIERIPKGSIIHITEKLHGTSGRTGHVLVDRKISWFWKLMGRRDKRWEHIFGSRNVVFYPGVTDLYYEKKSFREDIHRRISLFKGEILYYEIVGWVCEGRPIMPAHTVSDKTLKKRYGEKMEYTYGCAPGVHRIYVYRITRVNEDGNAIDLSWPQVIRRCEDLDIASVPSIETIIYDGDQEALLKKCSKLADGPSLLDENQIREGICLRVEHSRCRAIYKYKSWHFCDMEGIQKNSDKFIDLEEIS